MADLAVPQQGQVFVVDPHSGVRGAVPESEVETYLSHGYRLENQEESNKAQQESRYGEGHGLQAAGEAVLSGASFGLSDLALSQLDPEGVAGRAEEHPYIRMAGETAGAIATGGMGLGAGVGAVGKGAEALVTAGREAGVGTRLLGSAVRVGTEGAFYGAGSGVSQLAMQKDPITWEGAAATIGSSALSGAELGAGLGVAGQIFGEGARAAKEFSQRQAEAITKGEEGVNRGAYPELASMDEKATAQAIAKHGEEIKAQKAADIEETTKGIETEQTRLGEMQKQQAKDLYKEAEAYEKWSSSPENFLPEEVRKNRKLIVKAGNKLIGGLDNEAGFVEKLGEGKFKTGLQEQSTFLKRYITKLEGVDEVAEREAFLKDLPKEGVVPAKGPEPEVPWNERKLTPIGETAPEVAPSPVREAYLSKDQAKIYQQWTGLDVIDKPMTVAEPELMLFRDAIARGEVPLERAQRLGVAQEMLDRNQKLLGRFEAVQAKPTSGTLESLKTRLEKVKADTTPTPYMQALKAHQAELQTKDLGHGIASGVGGMLGSKFGWAMGPAGSIAGAFIGRDMAGKFYDRFARKLVQGNIARTKAMKLAIARMFEKGASGVERAAPKASKIIPAIQYASKEHAESQLGPDKHVGSKDATIEGARQRIRELNSMTTRAPDGSYQIRQKAADDIHNRMAAVWAANAMLANGIEKAHQQRLIYLASKAPRDPSPPHLQLGPSTWEPSREQAAKFARIMEAAEHPEVVPERLADGTATPDDVETLKTLFPSHYEMVRQEVLTHASQLEHTLPYKQRLQISLLLDVDVDPALTPTVLQIYQAPPAPPAKPPGPPDVKPMPTGMIEPTTAQRFSK